MYQWKCSLHNIVTREKIFIKQLTGKLMIKNRWKFECHFIAVERCDYCYQKHADDFYQSFLKISLIVNNMWYRSVIYMYECNNQPWFDKVFVMSAGFRTRVQTLKKKKTDVNPLIFLNRIRISNRDPYLLKNIHLSNEDPQLWCWSYFYQLAVNND